MRANEYSAMFQAESEHCWYKSLRDEVAECIALHAKEKPAAAEIKLLDVGCGTGGMMLRLQEQFKQINGCGMDFYELPLQFAKKVTRWPLVQADAKQLPFQPGSFDIILCLDVLYTREVFPALDAVLGDTRRLLAPGGMLILQVPAFKALYSQHDVNVHGAHRFTAREIREALQRAGFSRINVYYRYNLFLGLAFILRKIIKRSDTSSHVVPPPALINFLFYKYLKLESSVNKLLKFPFGLSVFANAYRCALTLLAEDWPVFLIF
ncbi:MAG: class I SAM-dependent methyltransferase [candidate division KSB1 bacterium]|nr:class I SAM-dependent methyltransferase [candidate division KSB1 bacterium]MDZ7366465.1 class I SAM-dependent methyltransferase [candidate division KSB1 bacterium]MDZ7404573.1 class I SAM-dependent methyltransferase [candidate division KSB1 bacterium]